ncbi:protein kinase family protein [Paenibacillus pini]|uniref:Pkinase n=1 Tax=Paenibacillus pini JCM 16418 TaxID=1236976 RepID=W7YD90_9BACL|nr:serine/threonine protein kinase [Paenibacillus pini]GAF08885.1 pkinase [Paenibacillus pini JCM 16418]
MSQNPHSFVIDDVHFQLQEACNFDWLHKIGRVFTVFDEQDSGNICFGIGKDGKKYFVKFAGAKPMDFAGNPQDAIHRLIEAIPLYETLEHPNLIQLISHFSVEHGYAAIFDWFDGECLHSHWKFAGHDKYNHPDSPFYRYRNLTIEKRLASLNTIFSFHEYIESKGYVAVDFYDGSILYNFENDTTKICDIDFYRKRTTTNDVGEDFWGSKRLKSPEEFILGAPIDEKTNVFNMGAIAFVLLGGELDRSYAIWEAGQELYEVALRAVHPDRELRFRNVAEFKKAWDYAQKA